ncbi:MAG: acyltransferase family protein [Candidatus Aminicenantales bacterium]
MASTVPPKARLWSLDTLRGFDMFWIIGGDAFFLALAKVTGWGWARQWGIQLDHVEWQGFHFYDLIFPLFMFISGVAIPYSLLAKAEGGGEKRAVYLRIVRRALLLVVLGFVYNHLLDLDFRNQRYASVLGQIGLAYLFAALIMLNVKSFKGRVAALAGILGGYAAVQLLVPVPGIGAGVLTPEGSINGFIDRLLLPGRFYDKIFDPEGILCVLSAVSVTLMGGLAGVLLRREKWNGYRKALVLAGTGAGLVALGLALKGWYPIIKKAWTSTFDIYAAGWSFLLLALFYLVVDVWGIRKWTLFFRVIGMNSITIYLGSRIVDFEATSKFLFGGLARLSGAAGVLVLAAGVIALEWLALYFLYKKRVFLKV